MTRQDDLRKMVAEATQGPWTHHEIDDWTVSDEVQAQKHEVVCCNTKYYPTGVSRENCRLIAQAPTLATDLAAALDKIERLEAALREIATDPRDTSVCTGDGWAYYTDAVNFARAALTTGEG